jgi:hypothetical protein
MSTPLRERPDAPLGTLIFRAGLLPAETIENALEEGVKTGRRLGEILVERNLIKEEDLTRLLAGQKGLPYVSLRERAVEPDAARLLAEDQARLFTALPIGFEEGVPVVAVADPTNDVLNRNIREALGQEARFVVVARSELNDVITEIFSGTYDGDTNGTELAAEAPEALDEAPAVDTRVPLSEPEDEDFAPEPELELEPEPVLEAAPPEPEPEPEPEPVMAAAPPLPEPEPVSAPEPVFAPEPVATPEPEPMVASEPEPAYEPEPMVASEPEPAYEPEPVFEPVPAVEPEPVFEAPAEPVIAAYEPPAVEPQPEPVLETPTPTVEQQPEPAPLATEPVAAESDPHTNGKVSETFEDDTPPPAASAGAGFRVSIRLTSGESLTVADCEDIGEAKGYAKALTKQLGATEADDWPFVNGRFLKPDTIVSVDVEPL